MNNRKIKTNLEKFYKTNKGYFDHMSETHDEIYFESIVRFIKNFNIKLDNKKILDIGCGSGSLIKVLRKESTKLKPYGIDISNLGHPEKVMNFYQTDAESLPFKDKFFDLVFLVDILEHVVNPQAVLKEAIRVLSKGGYILIRTPSILSPIIYKLSLKEYIRHQLGFYAGCSNDLSEIKRLTPNLKENVIGGDEDAVSGIFYDNLLQELSNNNIKVIKSETWGGGLKHPQLIRIANYIPFLQLLGSSITILGKKF